MNAHGKNARYGLRPAARRMAGRMLSVLCLVVLLAGFAGFGASRTAYADCSCDCVIAHHNNLRSFIVNQHDLTRLHITQEFKQHQRWWLTDFFNQYILPAEMMMTEQLTAVGMHQMEMIGAMIDAKQQLESQQLFQKMTAEAHRDYQSSHGMCTFATTARSLANTDRRAEATAHIMGRRAMARQLGNVNAISANGRVGDLESRIAEFTARYCDIHDNNGDLKDFCTSSAPAATINKDIDYNRLIDTPMSLDIDFMDTTNPAGDEEDVLALAANLFSHKVFERLGEDESAVLANNQKYFDMRTVVAKRSVAENSFYSIVGMKAKGSQEDEVTAGYVGVILQQLGVPDAEVFTMLGDRPSYYALMDILSQKIYQRPEFYTELYDTVPNVKRKDASMRAIGLMLDRDTYKSELRFESMLAVLVELELMQQQRKVENRIKGLNERFKPYMPARPGAPTP